MIKSDTDFPSQEEIDKQESLSLARLSRLYPKNSLPKDIEESRPDSNIYELMNWVSNTFAFKLKDSSYLNKFIQQNNS